MRRMAAVVLATAATFAGCDYPRDPENTLDHVEGGVLRAGVIESPPWVDLSG
jgi:hypothetical protein